MKTPEHERLDLRQAFERLSDNNEDLTRIVMNALPPLDYDQFATKADLAVLDAKFDAKFDKVDARFTELEGRLSLQMANQLRTILLMQLATFAGMVAFIARFG